MLIPAAVTMPDIPVVVSGGIATGSVMAVVLALGAEGVNMGARFLSMVESPVHQAFKHGLVAMPGKPIPSWCCAAA